MDNSQITRRHALQAAGGLMLATAASSLVGGAALAQGKKVEMKVTQVRNATLLVEYDGARFLVDPMLAEPGAFPAFPKTPNPRPNPMVPLPVGVADLLNVDAVIVTHLHADHWDEAAQNAVPKTLPIFAQDEKDAEVIRGQGFEDVRVLTPETTFKNVSLARTSGLHGSPAVIEKVGEDFGRVCGVVFSQAGAKTLYVAGDTVWNDDVASAIKTYKPDAIVLNTGDAYVFGVGSLIMGVEDVLAVHKAAPEAILIASHMEAVNHCVLSRGALQAYADEQGFLDQLRTPADGETLTV